MPTTRFASASGKSMDQDMPSETPVEARHKAYQMRKKRDGSHLLGKQKTMVQWIEYATRLDRDHFLWSSSESGSCFIETILERAYKGKYKDFASFKSDINTLYSLVLRVVGQTRHELDAFKELFSELESSLILEASRHQETLTSSHDLFDLVSLFRPTADGYAFTDMITKDTSKHYPQGIQEVVVYPAQPAEKEQIPTLKDVVAPPPQYYPKILKHENKPSLPVQWLDFGAFSSFAPASDSNNATMTYRDTWMGRSVHHESKQDTMDIDPEESNEAWLAKEGLDIQLIQEAMDKQPDSIDEELEYNSQLLEALLNYQKTRLNPDTANEQELDIAKQLEANIQQMLSTLPPHATCESSMIKEAMTRLPVFESAYRGTLPPHKIFSFPTTEKAETLPPYANITPTYSKDHWRLVKIAPLPTKDMTGNFPVVSMVEQQQLNFYQQKPPQQQQQQQQQQRMMPVPSYPISQRR